MLETRKLEPPETLLAAKAPELPLNAERSVDIALPGISLVKKKFTVNANMNTVR